MHPFTRSLRSSSAFSLVFLTAAVIAAQPAADAPFFSQDSLVRPSATDPALPPQADRSLASIRIPFLAADARDPRVSFYASTFAGTVFVTPEGKLVYSLHARKGQERDWTLTETLVSGKARPRGDGMTPTRVSSFVGKDPSGWRTNEPTYDAVALGEVWPGIEMRLRAYGRTTEKLFVVNPGAKASRIQMRLDGALTLKVNADGALVATTGLGDVAFSRPVAYQEAAGARHEIRAAYEVHGDRYGFRLGGYDPKMPVVIDPILQSTYLGGSNQDILRALIIHPSTGEIYVAGATNSMNFPGTTGGAQPTKKADFDAFVARLDSSLTTLKQATYLGAGQDDSAAAVAVHPTTGELFVAGVTTSSDFPGTAGGAQPNGNNLDIFVARLSADLTKLNQSTYLGGSNFDELSALAIDPQTGKVFVSGQTISTDFPGTLGGAQPAHGGGAYDVIVAQLNAALTTLNQATYLGGSGGTDESVAIAIHPITGEVYVTGQTDSVESPGTDSTGFPGTAGGAQNEGGIFVARLNPDLTTLGQATYLGKGCEEAYPHALAIASKSGDVYVAGEARANCSGTAGGAQPSNGGRMDVFVARLNANLTALAQATYLGASGDEGAIGVSIQPLTGDIYLSGYTDSSNFPGTAGGVQAGHAGMGDAFLARLGGSLTTLKQATYLGGTRSDSASAVAIHPVTGELFVAGVTESLDFPGTAGGPQSEYGDGASDGFIARLSPDLKGSGSLLNSFVTFNPVTTTYSTSSPTSGCPAGVFRIKARLRNTSAHALSHLRAEVATLTNGNLLKNADGGPGGVGAILTIPAGGAYADGVLAPNEFVDASFAICLTKKSAFDFFVDVFGTAE